MTLRGLPIVVCLLMPFGICTTVSAWTADHEAGICCGSGGGGAGGASGAGNGSTGGNGGVDGGDIGIDAGGDPSGAPALQRAVRPYSLRAVYFRRDHFKSTADCLATAHGQGLPLEVCQ